MKHNGEARWIRRAIETHNFHVMNLKEDKNHTIGDTARLLKRSKGSICEDLLIADWFRSHEDRIKEFKYAKDALVFIREQKHRLETKTI